MSDKENSSYKLPSILSKTLVPGPADEAIAAGLYPYFRKIASTSENGTTVRLANGKELLMFGSNSYLGLNHDSRVKKAALDAIEKYGTGNGGSRFLNGNLDIHEQLETALAAMVEKPAALLYPAGYMANEGTIAAIAGHGDYIFSDRSDHASIKAGCQASFAKTYRFNHKDMGDLEALLSRVPYQSGKLIVTDGVFSMEGDIAPLPAICDLAEKYNAAVMVDDAHSLGVLGKQGRGTASYFDMADRVHLIMGTFSKTLGTEGGFIAGDKITIENYLRHHAATQMFSASIPASAAATALKAQEIMLQEPDRISNLWANTYLMKSKLTCAGFNLGASATPILPVYIRDTNLALYYCNKLEEEGIFVNPVVSPGVPEGNELLRLSLMATHTPEQIHFAVDKIIKVGKELGIIS